MRISDWSSDVCSSDLFRIVELPQLGPLVLRVPAVIGRTERKHPFLRPALLLIAPRPAERRVETIFIQRLFQPLGLPHVGVQRAVIERIEDRKSTRLNSSH